MGGHDATAARERRDLRAFILASCFAFTTGIDQEVARMVVERSRESYFNGDMARRAASMTAEIIESPWYVRTAERFGLPTILLLAVGFGVREAAFALHHDVLVPVVKAHEAFLTRTGEAIERQSITLDQVSTTQTEIKQILDRVEGKN